MREPAFWWRPPGAASALLSPFSTVYGAFTASRMAKPGTSAGIPVVCVGNLTVGGAGKTPTAIAVAELLTAAGRRPCFLSRGYGGALAGPVRVDADVHRATDVGDEPLLLARNAPAIVAHDRVAGASLARAEGADVVLMDDGFQNPSLRKDLCVVVVDGMRGIGNGRVLPAGPLRAPLAPQLDRTNAVVVIGGGAAADAVAEAARERGIPVFHARLEPDPQAIETLRQRPVLAFAGIGHPDKFFDTLTACGIELRARRAFGDHHRYTADEAAGLLDRATRDGLTLVTTEKDAARLRGDAAVARLAAVVRLLPVKLQFGDATAFRTLLLSKVAGR